MTAADRLNIILSKLSPEMAHQVQHGWGPSGAPYSIETLADNRRRIVVTDPVTGEVFGATGATVPAAIAALEERCALLFPALFPHKETPAHG